MFYCDVLLPPTFFRPTQKQLAAIWEKANQLTTWGRVTKEGEDPKLVPHWLAVRGTTPMHTDPRYPRYSHQLKISVGEGVRVRGIDHQSLDLYRGRFYILDAHSPHQVHCTLDKKAHNISISIDRHQQLRPEDAISLLMRYAGEHADTFDQ